jgi:amino acid transporter
MKKVILRYGGYAALFELIIFVLIWVVIYLFNPSHKIQGYIGWVNLLCPLIFIYFGIRYYRDNFNNGHITFLNAVKIGLLIALIPALAFALIETVYVIYIDPKFYETIARYDLEQYRKTLSPEAFALKVKEMKQQLVISNNPVYNFVTMILIIGALGTLTTLISAVLLKRKQSKSIVV